MSIARKGTYSWRVFCGLSSSSMLFPPTAAAVSACVACKMTTASADNTNVASFQLIMAPDNRVNKQINSRSTSTKFLSLFVSHCVQFESLNTEGNFEKLKMSNVIQVPIESNRHCEWEIKIVYFYLLESNWRRMWEVDCFQLSRDKLYNKQYGCLRSRFPKPHINWHLAQLASSFGCGSSGNSDR